MASSVPCQVPRRHTADHVVCSALLLISVVCKMWDNISSASFCFVSITSPCAVVLSVPWASLYNEVVGLELSNVVLWSCLFTLFALVSHFV